MSEETLLEFPCQFPIKAMGKNQAELEMTVIKLIPHMDEQSITARKSKNDNYLALTIMINAHSKQQLDAIYQDLTAHPLILYVL